LNKSDWNRRGTIGRRPRADREQAALLFGQGVQAVRAGAGRRRWLCRARRPNLRVLYTSGYADNAIAEHGPSMADAPLLSKPYRRPELAQMVRLALDGRA
jgi:hypothetical protein